MMQIVTLLALLVLHFVSGYGILVLFNVRLKAVMQGALAVMIGVGVASVMPFLLQLFFLPLTPATVFGSLVFAAVALNIKTLLKPKEYLKMPAFALRIRLYEVPFIILLGYLVIVSVWRCYYMPPTPRDMLSGPEVIAEYAVKEHTMLNSIFNINLETTNNQFKSPYVACLQIIYKMAGFPFGQLWLSMLFVSFTVFLYRALTEKIHPVFAGILLVLFTIAPELYAYTFMILFDYSNTVFLFLGLFFLFRYFENKQNSYFYFSTTLFAIAIYIRSETLVLVAMMVPAIWLMQYRNKVSYLKMALMAAALMLICFVGYYIPTELYNNHYLPVKYEVAGLVNHDLGNLDPLWNRFSDMNEKMLFGEYAIQLWGYFIYVFAAFFLAELVIRRKFNRDARNWLYATAVVYIGLAILGYLLPLMDLNNTTKRGMFKVLPLMLLYMASNDLLIRASNWIRKWEIGAPAVESEVRPAKVAVPVKPKPKQSPTKKKN